MKTTKDIHQKSVKSFAEKFFADPSTIISDGFRSYGPALTEFEHHPQRYDPKSGMLHWLHILVSNAKTFLLGTCHGLPIKFLDHYLDEFCFRFSRRSFGAALLQHLTIAVAPSHADKKG